MIVKMKELSVEWNLQTDNFKATKGTSWGDIVEWAFIDTEMCGYQEHNLAPKVTKPNSGKRKKTSKAINLCSNIWFRKFPFLLEQKDVYMVEITNIHFLSSF